MLLTLSLFAKIEEKQVYATLKAKHADLYQKPYQCAKKKVNYFKKGDRIKIFSCDKYQWCKTEHGFVKKNLLLLPQSFIQKQKKMQKVELIPSPITPSPMRQSSTDKIQTKALIKGKIEKQPLDAYDEYFSGESKKVIFQGEK